MKERSRAVAEKPLEQRGIETLLLSSYYSSNTKFPQTRFYFVIDFASRLESTWLVNVLGEGVQVPKPVLEALARNASLTHQHFGVRKALTPDMIVADIGKMLRALEATYMKYSSLRGEKHFIADCAVLKLEIDERVDLSRRYIDQVASRQLGAEATANVNRLERHLLGELMNEVNSASSDLLVALEKEIVRPIWVLERH
jgi:hypothetical protein